MPYTARAAHKGAQRSPSRSHENRRQRWSRAGGACGTPLLIALRALRAYESAVARMEAGGAENVCVCHPAMHVAASEGTHGVPNHDEAASRGAVRNSLTSAYCPANARVGRPAAECILGSINAKCIFTESWPAAPQRQNRRKRKRLIYRLDWKRVCFIWRSTAAVLDSFASYKKPDLSSQKCVKSAQVRAYCLAVVSV